MNSVYLEKKNQIATIFLNRAEKRNALKYQMWVTITKLMEQCEEDREIKVVIIRGVDETAFAAGADISEFQTLRYDAEGAERYNQAIRMAERAITHLSKPTIAMIQSYCIGGGCEIALACDFRFSDTKGRFAVTPAKLGLVYNVPATQNLVNVVGPAKAKDILFTGRHLTAEEALKIGLLDRIFECDEIVERTYEYAQLICQNAQFSVRGSKLIIRHLVENETKELQMLDKLILDSFETADYKEGVQAFLEKRKPIFNYS